MDNEGYYGLQELLILIQQRLTSSCPELFSDKIRPMNTSDDDRELLVSLIGQQIRELGAAVKNMTRAELTERLYNEMAGYSILTPWLSSSDLEEININGWDDIALTLRDGRIIKAPEHFFSPSHAEDIVRRLLRNSGMILDSSAPLSQGHLPGNNRITALKAPLIDSDRGVCASIRLLSHSSINLQSLINRGMATPEMISFLRLICRYGVSFVVSGATSSGKTTLLNAVLADMPDDKRIFTIESGARELSLLRQNSAGKITNNVVHTISRPSDNERQDIKQEDLVVASLRYNPDIVCIGEMRDVECYAAVEAAMTGHTVVSTVHSGSGESAHLRIALLCQKKFPIDFNLSMFQAAQAFPIVVYCGKNEDNVRRIIDISECVSDYSGNRSYRTLFRYNPGTGERDGRFECCASASAALRKKLTEHGAPSGMLDQFGFDK